MSISISHFLYWLAAYLAGAIPFGWIIVKIIKNKDIRYIASGRMGMSNVMRVAGIFWGIVTAVLDVLKGIAAIRIANLFIPEPEPWMTTIGGILAVLGHIYSVFREVSRTSAIGKAKSPHLGIPGISRPGTGGRTLLPLPSGTAQACSRWERSGQGGQDLIHRAGDCVEKLVHELGFLRLRDVHDGFQPAAGEPPGLRMRGTAARQHQHAGVGPEHGVQIGLEPGLGDRMRKAGDILPDAPLLPPRIHICPMESSPSVRRIPEIINLMPRLPQPPHHLRLIRIPPTACDVDF